LLSKIARKIYPIKNKFGASATPILPELISEINHASKKMLTFV